MNPNKPQLLEEFLRPIVKMFVSEMKASGLEIVHTSTPTSDNKPGLLTRAEAAEYLGISRTGFFRLEREKIIKRVQVTPGKKGARYKMADLNEFIEQRSQIKAQMKDH